MRIMFLRAPSSDIDGILLHGLTDTRLPLLSSAPPPLDDQEILAVDVTAIGLTGESGEFWTSATVIPPERCRRFLPTMIWSPPEAALAKVETIAQQVRDYLETVWEAPDDEDDPISKDQCGSSSMLLCWILQQELPGGWYVAGGAEDIRDRMNEPDLVPDAVIGGMMDRYGLWHDHYWVRSDRFGIIVDITADQFGYGPVTVVPQWDARYSANWTSEAIKRHGLDLRRQVQDWRADIDASRNLKL